MQNSINYGHTEQIISPQGYRSPFNMPRAIKERFFDLLIILIPLMSFLEFKIVGRLFATEIILICLFPILLFTKHDVDITINLSESLSCEDLFGYI